LYLTQLTTGQGDPEQVLQDLLDQTTDEFRKYFKPLLTRQMKYEDMVSEESRQLESYRSSLREGMQQLALDLSGNGVDVTICLDIALENVTTRVDDLGKQDM
jgi:hypothetical protein